jgi:hypothetical protein
MGERCVAEGLGFNRIGEKSGAVMFGHVVFVPNSSEGMTGGVWVSVTEGGESNGSGRERKMAVGRLRSRAGFCPRAF